MDGTCISGCPSRIPLVKTRRGHAQSLLAFLLANLHLQPLDGVLEPMPFLDQLLKPKSIGIGCRRLLPLGMSGRTGSRTGRGTRATSGGGQPLSLELLSAHQSIISKLELLKPGIDGVDERDDFRLNLGHQGGLGSLELGFGRDFKVLETAKSDVG